MAYKKIYKRKFVRRKRRSFKRVPRRRINNTVHSFKQTAELNNISMSAGTTSLFGYQFTFDELTNAGSLNTIYDQYRILAVKITFYPQITNYVTNATSPVNATPVIYTVIDYDSSQPPGSVTELDQYTNCRRQQFTRPHSRFFKPNALGLVYITGTTSGQFQLPRGRWLDLANMNIPHFGIKGAITASQQNMIVAQTVRVSATLYVQCKNVR